MARDPSLTYIEKKKKGNVDRVELNLQGSQSAALTNILNRYKKLEKLINKLTDKRLTMNDDIKGRVEELFDVTDEVYTRIVETVSASLSLAKRAAATTREEFDMESYVLHLEQLAQLNEEDIQKLRSAYKKIVDVAPKSPKLTVKIKESKNNVLDKIEAYSKRAANIIRRNFRRYDEIYQELVEL